ncbi:MAG: acyl-CoA dehydrogenase [Clostridiales bacterium]|nr:acyl-CoA dehydrogenase [Clostridiales bacterium]
MDFKFTPEEQDIIDMIREFSIKEVLPIAAELDEEERFPADTVAKLSEMGMMGLSFPEEYGGAGLSYITYIAVCEELAKYCASTSVTLSAHCSLCCWPINEYGTEEQKQKYLAPLLAGETLGAFGLTEASAGSDAAMQKTTAVDKGDHWLINGSKIFITNAGYADTFVVIAMTDKEKGNRGISAFIVEKGFQGFSIGTKEKKMGIRASSTCELIFEDMIVPKENLLGELNKGFKVALSTLDGGRLSIAAQALGIAEAAIAECIKYVKERVQFGQPIARFQNTQFELAEMYAKVEAARFFTYRAAQAKQDGESYGHLAAMAKLLASDTANDIARRCLQLIGGYGYTREYPFERFMRDAKITEIYEGTSEVQKMVIANYLDLK